MGKLGDGLIGLGVVGVLAYAIGSAIKDNKEEERRRSTPCTFDGFLSSEEFAYIAVSEGKKIKRLWVSVDGPIVYGTVRSVSGLSEWEFSLDFNDYGTVTGRYWIHSDNDDSTIPHTLAKRIVEGINRII